MQSGSSSFMLILRSCRSPVIPHQHRHSRFLVGALSSFNPRRGSSPHGPPSGIGDPPGAGTGAISTPLSLSGPGRGMEFGDRGGDGGRSPDPAPPRCHPEPQHKPPRKSELVPCQKGPQRISLYYECIRIPSVAGLDFGV
jgi:hypothetical protein